MTRSARSVRCLAGCNPDSPYTSFFDGDSQDGNTVGLLTSAVGYYVNTPHPEEAQALSSALELLTFLMFHCGSAYASSQRRGASSASASNLDSMCSTEQRPTSPSRTSSSPCRTIEMTSWAI